MPYTGHVRKRTTKSGITTYQVIVEEESSFANGKRKRYYKTIQGGKKQAEKVMRDMIHELETRTFVKDNRITVRDFMHQWLEIYVKNQLSPTTVQHYIDQTEKYIIPQFGDTCLQQMDLFSAKGISQNRKAAFAQDDQKHLVESLGGNEKGSHARTDSKESL